MLVLRRDNVRPCNEAKRRRKLSQRQEREFAKRHGGRAVPASGSLWGAKGDTKLEKFLVEHKWTYSNSYRISAKIWNKIRKEAIREGLREPMYQIQFHPGVNQLDLVVVDINCPFLANRDKDWKLVGERKYGGVTVETNRSEWERKVPPKHYLCQVVHVSCKDKDTKETLFFKLLVMKEKDFFNYINMV